MLKPRTPSVGKAGTKRLVPLEQATEALLSRTAPLNRHEEVSLFEAAGRVAYDDVVAVIDQPPFDRSPLDGYALRHEDTAGATFEAPVSLRITQYISVGCDVMHPLRAGEAARLVTGAMIPPGADCVIRQEDTDAEASVVTLYRELSPHENYCFAGEDIRRGEFSAYRGQRLSSAQAGLLAGQGMERVRVFERPRVGILSTGDELLSGGQMPVRGKIYDSNAVFLANRLVTLGMRPIVAKPCGDDPEALKNSLEALLEECDMVVTTGGVSVGPKDHMPSVAEMLGAEMLFHGVDIKPGSSALGMVKNEVPVVCLSGNPFAAVATFEILGRPVAEKLGGNFAPLPERQSGIARDAFRKKGGMRRLVRANFCEGTISFPPQGHDAGSLAALVGCNCLADIPANFPPVSRGSRLSVILL